MGYMGVWRSLAANVIRAILTLKRNALDRLLSSRATRAGIGYTVANLLIKGISLITLPVFSRVMSVEEMGLYSVWVSYDSIVFVFIGLALHASVKSANRKFEGRIDEYLSSVSLVYFVGLVALAALVTLLNPWLEGLTGVGYVAWLLMLVVSLSSAFTSLYNNAVSLDYSYRDYMRVAAVNSAGNVAASLALMFTAFSSDRYMARVVGTAAVSVVVIAMVLRRFWGAARPRYDGEFWRFGIRYSLPIVPHGVSQVLLSSADRVMINSLNGAAAAGMYSLAGYVLQGFTVIVNSVDPVWSTWFFERMAGGGGDARTRIRSRAASLSLGYAALAVGVVALSPEIVAVLGGEKYAEAAYVAPLIAASGYLILVYNLVCTGEYWAAKTGYIAAGTVGAAAINIALNAFLLPAFGFVAAGWTTTASYLAYVAFHMVICRRCVGFHVLSPATFLLECAAIAVATTAALLAVGSLPVRLAAGAAALGVLALALRRNRTNVKNTSEEP